MWFIGPRLENHNSCSFSLHALVSNVPTHLNMPLYAFTLALHVITYKYSYMKNVFLLLATTVCLFNCYSQSIYSIGFNDIDGNNISIAQYQNKKVLFLIAPISTTDSLLIDGIISFKDHFGDSIQLVGIMSVEDGYSSANRQSIKELYQSRGINILLTEGMYTRKSSGAGQSALLQWLTDKEDNKRFNTDASGIGHKFFVSRMGKLLGSVSAQVPFSDPICGWMAVREL